MKVLRHNKKVLKTVVFNEEDFSVLRYELLLNVNGAGGSGGGSSGGPSGPSSSGSSASGSTTASTNTNTSSTNTNVPSANNGSGLTQEWIDNNVPAQYKDAAQGALQRQNEEKAGIYGAPTDSTRVTAGIGGETPLQSAHTGVDIGATTPGEKGAPIYAVADGTIKRTGTTSSGSTRVEQSLPYTNDTAVYQHADFIVSEGQTVRRRDVIGYMSDNGTPGQVHLHYEIREDGVYAGNDSSKIVNPLDHMPSSYQMN